MIETDVYQGVKSEMMVSGEVPVISIRRLEEELWRGFLVEDSGNIPH